MAEAPDYVKHIPNPYFPTSSQRSPYFLIEPDSIKADVKGLHEGELVLANHAAAAKLEKIQEKLQKELDRKKTNLKIIPTYFQNWSGLEKNLLLYVKPTKRSQIQILVKEVAKIKHEDGRQMKIGMGGAYHTWSPMFPDEGGVLINTRDLTLGLRELPTGFISSDVWPDPKNPKMPKPDKIDRKTRIILHTYNNEKVVTISPGVTTGELMEFFLKYDVCFECDVILPTVTYGGVFSGGCHGVGRDQPSMSDWIVSMTLVDGRGGLKTLNEGDKLLAGQTSLGVLGVVLEYTVKVQEMSYCRVQNDFEMKLGDICTYFNHHMGNDGKNLGQLLKKHWSVELFWFPFNGIIEALLNCMPKPTSSTDETVSAGSSLQEANIPVLFSAPKSGQVSTRSVHQEEVAGLSESISEFAYLGEADKEFAPVTDAKEKPGKDQLKVSIPKMLGGSFNLIGWLMKLWYPQYDRLWVRAIDIIRKPHQAENHRISCEPGVPGWSKLVDIATHVGGNTMFGEMHKRARNYIPFAVGAGFQGVKFQYSQHGDEIVRTPWAVHYRDAIDLMTANDLEFAFPINIDNPTRAVKAIREVVQITKKFAWGTNFPLTLCLEMRVMSRSSALLNPASVKGEKGEDHIAFIEVLGTTGTQGYKDFFSQVAVAWMMLGGVPHWHKEFYRLDRGTEIINHMRKEYGHDKIERFNAVRKELDPKDIFLNTMMNTFLFDHHY